MRSAIASWLHLAFMFNLPESSPRVLQRRDTTISSNQRDGTFDQSFGQISQTTTVNPGVTYWLSGGGIHTFFGNFIDYGSILISQSDYTFFDTTVSGMLCTYTGHDRSNGIFNISNTGSLYLNDFGTITPSSYDWDIYSFTNNGTMQWCARGDTGGSSYQLICDRDCYNNGLIDWEQYYGSFGILFNWHNTILAPAGTTNFYNIYNNGAFRLIRTTFVSVQNVLGNGCWVLGDQGTLYLSDGSALNQNPGYGPVYPNQNIYFSSNNGTLHLDYQVYARNSNFGPQIYGFSGGNSIEFIDPIIGFGGISYGTTTGVLTVRFYSGSTVNLKIGLGYLATSFVVRTNLRQYGIYNAIYYTGAVAVAVPPTKCILTQPTCADPEQTAGLLLPRSTSTSSSSTSTSSLVPSFRTTSLPYSGTGAITAPITTTISLPSGTNPGVIAVITPTLSSTSSSTTAAASYITTSIGYSGTGQSTSTVRQPSGTSPGTVAIYYPTSTPTSRPATVTTNIGPNQCRCTPS